MEVSVNLAAVVAAALAYFVIGWLWFSPLMFLKPWMEEQGLSMEKMQKDPQRNKKMIKPMVMGLIFALITSYVMAHFVDAMNATNISDGAQLGAWLWLGFVLPVCMGAYMWGGKSLKFSAITASHELAGMAVMAMILAAWPA